MQLHQTQSGFLKKYRDTIAREYTRLNRAGNYSGDKLLSSLSLGVWTHLFSRASYRDSGKTLLAVFPNKPKGINQKSIYQDLDSIRSFRNRVAHYEPICFDLTGARNTNPVIATLVTIKRYLDYLGYDPDGILYGVGKPERIIELIDKF